MQFVSIGESDGVIELNCECCTMLLNAAGG